MPYPPRLAVGGDYERGLTLAACPLGGANAIYGELLLYICTFVCVCDQVSLGGWVGVCVTR